MHGVNGSGGVGVQLHLLWYSTPIGGEDFMKYYRNERDYGRACVHFQLL